METKISRWTVKELQSYLRPFNISTSGNKDVLIQRIIDDFATPNRYSRFTVVKLKDILRARTLPVSGNKTKLIDRLNVYDSKLVTTRSSPRKVLPKRKPSSRKVSPRNTPAKSRLFSDIPDVDRIMLSNLDDTDLLNACDLNVYTKLLCNPNFWKERIIDKYGIDLSSYKGNRSFRKMYEIFSGGGYDLDTELVTAAKKGYLPLVKVLIEYKNVDNRELLRDGISEAIKGGHLPVVKYLMENTKPRTFIFYQVLDTAASAGKLDIVKYLIEELGGRSSLIDIPISHSPVISAAEKGHLQVLKYLIEKGAEVGVGHDSPLAWAALNGHLKVVKYLIEESGIDFILDYNVIGRAREGKHDKVIQYITEQMLETEYEYLLSD